MNDEARLLFTLWETVTEYISVGDRQEAAASIIRILIDLGNNIELLRDAEGECNYLDKAIDEVSAEQECDDDLLEEFED